MSDPGLLVVETLAVVALVFVTHAARKRLSLAPFFALLGCLACVSTWAADAGVTVEVGEMTLLVASTVYFGAILLAVLMVYAIDGVGAARAAIVSVAGVTLLTGLTTLFLREHVADQPGNALAMIPDPRLKAYVASVVAIVADLIVMTIVWEALGRPLKRAWIGIRLFVVFLAVLWLDSLLYVSGAYLGEPEFVERLTSIATARLVTAIALSPPLALYLSWHQRRTGAGLAQRPTFAIVSEASSIRRELVSAREEIERRIEVEGVLQRRDAILEAVRAVGERFLDPERHQADLRGSLRLLGEASGVSRVYVFENHVEEDGRVHGRQRAEWVAEGVESTLDDPVLQSLDYDGEGLADWRARLERGEVVGGVVSELDEGKRRFLGRHGVLATLGFPVMAGDHWWGVIGFDAADEERRWSQAEVHALQSAASTIAAAVLRRRAEEQRHELELRVHHAERLESLGVLAGGIAHDFNNLMTGVVGNLSLARLALQQGDLEAAQETLDSVESVSSQVTGLTKQLMTFTRGGEPVTEVVDLGGLLRETVPFTLRGSLSNVRFDLPDDLPPVTADPSQLSQAFGNLAINARQAMPGGGTLHVAGSSVRVDGESSLPLSEGPFVRIRFRDEGVGIPEEAIKRIFDPFFSTKDESRGLGLATCFNIMARHHGTVVVDSRAGWGTTFDVYLPASDAPAPPPAERSPEIQTGTGRVLVMDDEVVVRQTLGRMLAHLGYEPEFALDGAEGLRTWERARNDGNPFAVIIMDLTVPGGMGGKEMVRRLHDLDPDAVAVVTSGYSTDPILSNHAAHGFVAAIPKPFRVRTVADALAEALGTA